MMTAVRPQPGSECLWTSVAEFTDSDGHLLELVRVKDGAAWTQLGGDRALLPVRGQIERMGRFALSPFRDIGPESSDYYIGFALIGLPNTPLWFTADAMLLQMTPEGHISEVMLTAKSVGQRLWGHSFHLETPENRQIWLWVLFELLDQDLDPDRISSEVRFIMGIPSPVRTKDRLVAEIDPELTDLQRVLDETQIVPFASGPGSVIAQLGKVQEAVHSILAKLRELGLGTPSRMPTVIRAPDEEVGVQFNMEFDGLVPYELYYRVIPKTWHIKLEDGTRDIATAGTALKLFFAANFHIDEAEWASWFDYHIADPAEVLLEIDLEPYRLLEAPSPFRWRDEAFNAFVGALESP